MQPIAETETIRTIRDEIERRRRQRGEESPAAKSSRNDSDKPNENDNQSIYDRPSGYRPPTPEERARPGFPWRYYPDPECTNCHDAGLVYQIHGLPATQQGLVACPVCCGGKAEAARLKYADLPESVKTFDQFKPELVANGQIALDSCREFVDRRTGEFFVTLHGNPGVGKSHLLQATARAAVDHDGMVVKYIYTPAFLKRLRQTFDDKGAETFDDIFSQYQTAELLVLDDLGAGRYTDWAIEQVEQLVEARYQAQAMTAFGSNLDVDVIAEKLGYRIADRIFDVGSGAALVVWMGGASYRSGLSWGKGA